MPDKIEVKKYTPPPIKGYKVLDQSQIDFINNIKGLADVVGNSLKAIETTDVDKRWMNIAKTNLQQGFMALTRAIAKPEGF